jgi:peptidylprolyl isomerase
MNWYKPLLVIFSLLSTATLSAPSALALNPENTLYMELKDGRVVIRMHPELAPRHCIRIKELVRQGFYDGLNFHRVIDGFMVQGGDPKGDGTGGSGQNIPQEFETFGSGISHTRGIVSMARAADPNSADSQFFIMLGDAPHLDNKYTIWGEVVEGMELVDNIKKGDRARNGAVDDPDQIIQMRVAADVDE